MPKVLCVDPDEGARSDTAATLEDLGATVTACADLETAVDELDAAIDCVVSEFELPDGTGLDLLATLRERHPDTAFVLFTDTDPDSVDTDALTGAITEYIPKGAPNAHHQLADLVQHTVAFRTQTAYPLPDDEAERVAALDAYRPVLAAAEPTFDRLTTLAGDLLDVPMTAVGIIDDREQEFLACYGVDFGVFPREETVCTYALLEPGVTTIPDLADDPRFAGNEGLESYDLRAYASANLTTPDGRVVGTFCAYDRVPREWTDDDRDNLRLLAAEAMETLELRRRLHESGADPSTEGGAREPAPAAGAPSERRADPAGGGESAPSDGGQRDPDDVDGGGGER